MNRRQLIKRGIAGSVAALVGLPEASKAKDFDRAARAKDKECADIVAPHHRNSLPVIQHTGDWHLFTETVLVSSGHGWGEYSLSPLHVDVFNLCITKAQWAWINKANTVRLELKSGDYDLTAYGRAAGCVGYTAVDALDGCLKYYGTFTFELEEMIEEITVNKQFPADRDRPFLPYEPIAKHFAARRDARMAFWCGHGQGQPNATT
ncbi:MAG: hypothetical protein ACYSUV_19430 [Planctomycetota bacterium]|jgi:hypothetical protein